MFRQSDKCKSMKKWRQNNKSIWTTKPNLTKETRSTREQGCRSKRRTMNGKKSGKKMQNFRKRRDNNRSGKISWTNRSRRKRFSLKCIIIKELWWRLWKQTRKEKWIWWSKNNRKQNLKGKRNAESWKLENRIFGRSYKKERRQEKPKTWTGINSKNKRKCKDWASSNKNKSRKGSKHNLSLIDKNKSKEKSNKKPNRKGRKNDRRTYWRS